MNVACLIRGRGGVGKIRPTGSFSFLAVCSVCLFFILRGEIRAIAQISH